MKKFFLTLGVIFLVLLVLGAIGFAYIAFRGNALDKESKAYVDSAIPAIFTNWNKSELLNRVSPEFRKATTDDQVNSIFQRFSALGRMMTFDAAEGHADMSITPQNGKMITARYKARAFYDKGNNAIITLDLIKHGDQWQIMAFFVYVPKPPPK